jgi:hypothetical protein
LDRLLLALFVPLPSFNDSPPSDWKAIAAREKIVSKLILFCQAIYKSFYSTDPGIKTQKSHHFSP